jgi:hypothetical protein
VTPALRQQVAEEIAAHSPGLVRMGAIQTYLREHGYEFDGHDVCDIARRINGEEA